MQRINTQSGQFTDGDPWNSVQGTPITAAWLNAVQAELVSICEAAGIALDASKNDQVLTAIARLFAGVPAAQDTGAANAVRISYVPSTAPRDGQTYVFIAAADNTGPVTVAMNGAAARPLLGQAQQPLQGGEIKAGGRALIAWHAASVAYVLLAATGGATQVAPATKSGHAVQFGQLGQLAQVAPGAFLTLDGGILNVQPNHWTRLNSPAAPVTLAAGRQYAIDTTGGPLPVLLPANPQPNDYVVIRDIGPVFQANPVTVQGNGKLIHGDSELLCNISGIEFGLGWNVQANQWKISMTLQLTALLSAMQQSAGNAPQVSAVGVSAEPLSAGDVAALHARDNRLYYALPPGSLGAELRPALATSATSINWATTPVIPWELTAGVTCARPSHIKAARMTNGNVALAWYSPYQGIIFAVTDPEGRQVVAPFYGPSISAANPTLINICPLTGGGFAVVFVRPDATVWHMPVSAAGITGTSRQFDTAPTTTAAYTVGIFPLANGGYVVSADIVMGGKPTPRLGVFAADGTQVTAPWTLATPAAGGTGVGVQTTDVVQLSGGNLLIACAASNSSTGVQPYIAVYTQAGVRQGALITPAGYTGAANLQPIQGAAMAAGNVGVIGLCSGGNLLHLFTVRGDGSLVSEQSIAPGAASPTLLGAFCPVGADRVVVPFSGGANAGLSALIVFADGTTQNAIMDGSIGPAIAGASPSQCVPLGTDRIAIFAHPDAVHTYQHSKPSNAWLFERVQTASGSSVATIATYDSCRLLPVNLPGQPAWAQLFTMVCISASQLKVETRCLQSRGPASPQGVISADTPAGVVAQAQISGSATTRLRWDRPLDLPAHAAAVNGVPTRITGNRAEMGVNALGSTRSPLGQIVVSGAATLPWVAPYNAQVELFLTGPASAGGGIWVNGVQLVSGTNSLPTIAKYITQLKAGETLTITTTAGASVSGYAEQI